MWSVHSLDASSWASLPVLVRLQVEDIPAVIRETLDAGASDDSVYL